MPTSTSNTAPSFNTTARTGIASTYMGNAATTMALQSDGKMVLGGYSYNSSSGYIGYSVVRLNADGSLDSSFSGDGKAVIDVDGDESVANSLVVQSDGKVVLGGYSYNSSSGSRDYGVVRLNADGSLDSSFSGICSPPPKPKRARFPAMGIN